jgi:hypothetical protein
MLKEYEEKEDIGLQWHKYIKIYVILKSVVNLLLMKTINGIMIK